MMLLVELQDSAPFQVQFRGGDHASDIQAETHNDLDQSHFADHRRTIRVGIACAADTRLVKLMHLFSEQALRFFMSKFRVSCKAR